MKAIILILTSGLLCAGATYTAFAVIAWWHGRKRDDTPDPRIEYRTQMWGGNVTMEK